MILIQICYIFALWIPKILFLRTEYRGVSTEEIEV